MLLLESRGAPLKADEVVGLTNYLAAQLGRTKLAVVPRGLLRRELAEQKGDEPRSGAGGQRRALQHASRGLGAEFMIEGCVAKVGSQCLTSIWTVPVADPGRSWAAVQRGSCNPDTIIEGIERLAAELSARLLAPSRPAPARRLSAALMESRGSPLSGNELVALTDYLAAHVSRIPGLAVLPVAFSGRRSDDGAGAKARYRLNSSITKVGSRCLLTAPIFDAEKDQTAMVASEKMPCDPDALIAGTESLAKQLAAGLDKSSAREAARGAEAP